MNERPRQGSQSLPADGTGHEPPLPPELSPRSGGRRRSLLRRPARQVEDVQRGPANHGTGRAYPPSPTLRRKSWLRRIVFASTTLIVTILATAYGTYDWADGQLNRAVDLAALPDPPSPGKGTNYLIAGSDNRRGLTPKQQQALHTGADDEGPFGNSDSMLILHVGAHGDTLLSLPRDSYLTIPGFTGTSGKRYPATRHKLNTAFSWGGGQLLSQTVEYNTGLHIDHYVEIGFGGFVNLVNALGGVHMCLDKAMIDDASGANFEAGCHTFNGGQSLAFVRERHQEPTQDLARMVNQHKFLAAVARQATAPSHLLNPFTFYPTLKAALTALSVDRTMDVNDLMTMFFALRDSFGSGGHSLTVPIANANYYTPADGDALLWDSAQSTLLFDELRGDQPLTNTHDANQG